MGYVYLICDPANDLYKIGVTRNLESQRIKKLQTGNPTELFIRSIYKTKWPFRLETMLHNFYRNRKVLNEWYQLDDCDVIDFQDICTKLDATIGALQSNPFFAKDLK